MEDLKSFISRNGHLPGIPTAPVVKSEGVDVATMHEKLLEKIEELTLYVIQLQEQNKELKNMLSKLESKL